jgi:glycine/D-amino acid oxidase-like deaminating enzyme
MSWQGGSGIMTSPAAARTLASLVFDGVVPEDLHAAGLRAEALSPVRDSLVRA